MTTTEKCQASKYVFLCSARCVLWTLECYNQRIDRIFA